MSDTMVTQNSAFSGIDITQIVCYKGVFYEKE